MDTQLQEKPRKFFRSNPILNVFFLISFLGILSYYLFSAPIDNRSLLNGESTIIHIENGQAMSSVASELENKNIVRHASILKLFIKVFSVGGRIDTGDYAFKPNAPVWQIAWQIARGIHNVSPIKVTLPEGKTNIEMANILAKHIPSFRRDLFLEEVDGKQGYLFPDTYFIYSLSTTDEIVSLLSANFNSQMKTFQKDIIGSGHTEKEIIIMASLIEGEAKGKDDALIISGILWKRIRIGMPLQVDVERSTYTTKGLPSSPISNPGLVAINASINSTDSPYLYYIHEKNGIVHFAKTFDEHKQNIKKYLK